MDIQGYKDKLDLVFGSGMMSDHSWDSIVEELAQWDMVEEAPHPQYYTENPTEYRLRQQRYFNIKWEEERKAGIALREYLLEVIETHVPETKYTRTVAEDAEKMELEAQN